MWCMVTCRYARNYYRHVEISSLWKLKELLGTGGNFHFFFFVCYYITNVEKDIIFCFVDRCRSWKTFWVHKLWLQSSLVPGLGIEFRSCGFCSDAFWLWHTSFLFLSETVKFSGCSWYALQLEEVTKLIYNNLINFS